LGVGYAVLAIGVFLIIVKTKWVVNEGTRTNENKQGTPAAAAA
jgi:hypothetical protein